jgi:hypothetical protein
VALNDHGSAPSLIPPTKRSLASGPGGNSSLRLNPRKHPSRTHRAIIALDRNDRELSAGAWPPCSLW